MKFEFGKATEITEYAKKRVPELYSDYHRIFITPDTKDHHLLRVIKDHNSEYEKEKGKYLVELEMISHKKHAPLSLRKLDEILDNDDGSSWDYKEFASETEVIKHIDGGFGINYC